MPLLNRDVDGGKVAPITPFYDADGNLIDALPVELAEPLAVALETGDIEIGAVEIKDGDSDRRSDVETDGVHNALVIRESNYAIQVAVDSGDSALTYVGKAAIGSATSSSVWQIKRIDTSSGTVIEWADGDEDFDNEWDDRESGSYS